MSGLKTEVLRFSTKYGVTRIAVSISCSFAKEYVEFNLVAAKAAWKKGPAGWCALPRDIRLDWLGRMDLTGKGQRGRFVKVIPQISRSLHPQVSTLNPKARRDGFV